MRTSSWPQRHLLPLGLLAFGAALVVLLPVVAAHGIEEGDRRFILDNPGPQPGPFLYLGAKHMVTGYDHLLFLVGVIFFLSQMRDVALYVSMFTLGHSTTLLVGVLADVPANAFLIDAIIGLSVVYKGFDNLGGFRRVLGFQPDTRIAVLVFGLFHGFGLATKLQEFGLAADGLLVNLVSFNVGVELGQILALSFIVVGMAYWRRTASFHRRAYATNVLLMAAGLVLFGYQMTGFFVS